RALSGRLSPPRSPLLPYTTLFRSTLDEALLQAEDMLEEAILGMIANNEEVPAPSPANGRPVARLPALTAAKLEVYLAMRQAGLEDRKSTRLNSSHVSISYADFCL